MTVYQIQATIETQLTPLFGEDEAKAMVSLLLQHHFRCSRLELSLKRKEEADPELLARLHKDTERLLQHVPIQYVTGETEFFGLHLAVSPAVLIPRPETEELVQLAVDVLKKIPHPATLLDIGTGSGCIALALKKQFPQSEVYALDVSDEALEVAKHNAGSNGLELHFLKENILFPKRKWKIPELDVIISNPPYITPAEKVQMQRNVLDYEPHRALFVPQVDPIIFYREIAIVARKKLKSGGHLLFEINEQYGKEMLDLLTEKGFRNPAVLRDFRGKERFCVAEK